MSTAKSLLADSLSKAWALAPAAAAITEHTKASDAVTEHSQALAATPNAPQADAVGNSSVGGAADPSHGDRCSDNEASQPSAESDDPETDTDESLSDTAGVMRSLFSTTFCNSYGQYTCAADTFL